MYVHWVCVFRNPERSEEDSGSWELSCRWLWVVTWETDLGLLRVFAISWSSLIVLHTNDHIIRATVHALRLSSVISLTLQGSFDTQMYAFLFLGYTSSTRITVSWSTCLNSRALTCFSASLLLLSCSIHAGLTKWSYPALSATLQNCELKNPLYGASGVL